jgi:ribbon-helix-helix CopG family protein
MHDRASPGQIATRAVAAVAERLGVDGDIVAFEEAVEAQARADATAAGATSDVIDSTIAIALNLSKHARATQRSTSGEWPTFVAIAPEPAPEPTQESQTDGKRDYRRVNVNFSVQAYQTLERLARQTGRSMSDVLRDAIALKSWFEQTRAEGGHVLVERPDGKIREIISV